MTFSDTLERNVRQSLVSQDAEQYEGHSGTQAWKPWPLRRSWDYRTDEAERPENPKYDSKHDVCFLMWWWSGALPDPTSSAPFLNLTCLRLFGRR